MNFFLVLEFFSGDFWSSPRQTDRRADRQKVTPESLPCWSTGVLKNYITRIGQWYTLLSPLEACIARVSYKIFLFSIISSELCPLWKVLSDYLLSTPVLARPTRIPHKFLNMTHHVRMKLQIQCSFIRMKFHISFFLYSFISQNIFINNGCKWE